MTTHSRIAPAVARALEGKGYTTLTEVQQAVLTDEAEGADLLVSAQTGSGKTVAFGLAIAPTLLGDDERFDHAAAPLALIVAPTRELALQVQREFIWLFGEAGGRVASCVGGMDARSERRALERGCHIVVGTPGRLRDHIERGALDMSSLRAVVLDEADEMLDFGFREDLEFILEGAPADRRTLLFSATVPKAIADIARRFQNNAVRLSTVSERGQHADIEYRALAVSPSDRENALINVLRFYEAERAIVFCATREAVNRLSSRFGNRGFAVVALSGELSQKERTHALQALRDGRARVCIATDVAARGIDLPGLELVVHADLPTNGDVLKHRSGRTGRAGQQGVCVMIVPQNQRGRANRLLRDARIEAEWGEAPSLSDIKAKDRERLFNDPSLTETYDDEAMTDARELLSQHSPEIIAAAFLNRMQASTPSAEDLMEMPAGNERKTERRAPFSGGAWFRLTAGRQQRAEPRWLLPLICRLGDVTRNEVGSIQIDDTETRFEIDGSHAERFAAAVRAAGGGEGSIQIMPAEGGRGTGPSAPAPRNDSPTPERPRDRKPVGKSFEKRAGAPEKRAGGPGKRFSPRPERDNYRPESGDGERKPFRKPRHDDRAPNAGSGEARPRKPFNEDRRPSGTGDSRPRKPFSEDRKSASTGDARPRKAYGSKPSVPTAGGPAKYRARPASPDGGRPDGNRYKGNNDTRKRSPVSSDGAAKFKRVKRKPRPQD